MCLQIIAPCFRCLPLEFYRHLLYEKLASNTDLRWKPDVSTLFALHASRLRYLIGNVTLILDALQ